LLFVQQQTVQLYCYSTAVQQTAGIAVCTADGPVSELRPEHRLVTEVVPRWNRCAGCVASVGEKGMVRGGVEGKGLFGRHRQRWEQNNNNLGLKYTEWSGMQ